MIDGFARAFPVWITLCSLIALVYPPAFSWFITGQVHLGGEAIELRSGGLVTPGLQVIMLSMGLTLRLSDFAAVAKQKWIVFSGVLLQFTIMPALGFAIAHVFSLPPPLAAGLILVCCCPGGTASNVIAFLAKADVPLSVAMTAVSTLLAAVVTPTLSALLIGAEVEVDVRTLYATTAQVVLLPILVGVSLRRFFEEEVGRIIRFLPSLAVVAIVLIVSGIIAVQRDLVLTSGLLVLACVVLTHGLAFFIAYWVAIFRGASVTAARTISIEVGMQNSGLGVVLARASFIDPLVAVTPAISAVVHCLCGSGVAAVWGRKSAAGAQPQAETRTQHDP